MNSETPGRRPVRGKPAIPAPEAIRRTKRRSGSGASWRLSGFPRERPRRRPAGGNRWSPLPPQGRNRLRHVRSSLPRVRRSLPPPRLRHLTRRPHPPPGLTLPDPRLQAHLRGRNRLPPHPAKPSRSPRHPCWPPPGNSPHGHGLNRPTARRLRAPIRYGNTITGTRTPGCARRSGNAPACDRRSSCANSSGRPRRFRGNRVRGYKGETTPEPGRRR